MIYFRRKKNQVVSLHLRKKIFCHLYTFLLKQPQGNWRMLWNLSSPSLFKSDNKFNFFRFPLPQLVKYGSWDVGGLKEAQKLAMDVMNVKFGQTKSLPFTVTDVDQVQARSAYFTELQSYWLLPLPSHSIVHEMVVTLGEFKHVFMCKN